MASSLSPWWRRWLQRNIPSLFYICPAKNYHWRTDRKCYCRNGEYSGDWHGGTLDIRTGREEPPWDSRCGPLTGDKDVASIPPKSPTAPGW
jgi:hypothetical protein